MINYIFLSHMFIRVTLDKLTILVAEQKPYVLIL